MEYRYSFSEREVIIMAWYSLGLSIEEIGNVIGYAYQTIKNDMYGMRKRCRATNNVVLYKRMVKAGCFDKGKS